MSSKNCKNNCIPYPPAKSRGFTVQRIINKAKCGLCGDIIESTYRHDFKECKCGEIFVDGGTDYFRRGWKTAEENHIEIFEECEEDV